MAKPLDDPTVATAAIDDVFDDMVDRRRAVHRQPELAFEEHATTDLIRSTMADLAIDEAPIRPTDTGGIFVLDGGQPGRTVVLRADIDGLPVHEDGAWSVRSDIDGVMHACGHDVHVGSMLGVARALASRPEALPGRYVFLFQPGEEALCGAKSMVDQGALDAMTGGRLIGFHVTSRMPTGLVALKSGVTMSEAHSLRITIEGPGGHGGMGITKGDVIRASAALVSRLSEVADGLSSEGTDCVCSAGMLHAGTAVNVVPTRATVEGTLRTFTPEQRDETLARLQSLCDEIGAEHEVTATFELPEHTPAVVSDAAVTELVEAQAQAALGSDHVIRMPPTSTSDDVSEFMNHLPGCYFFVGGAAVDGSSGQHHSPAFYVEDESLRVGASVMLRSALALAAP